MSTPYSSYLASPAWKARRAKILAKRSRYCARCGRLIKSLQDLELHHKSYNADLELVPDSEIVLLHSACHKKLHAALEVKRLAEPEEW